jgi:hypothetical protein
MWLLNGCWRLWEGPDLHEQVTRPQFAPRNKRFRPYYWRVEVEWAQEREDLGMWLYPGAPESRHIKWLRAHIGNTAATWDTRVVHPEDELLPQLCFYFVKETHACLFCAV